MRMSPIFGNKNWFFGNELLAIPYCSGVKGNKAFLVCFFGTKMENEIICFGSPVPLIASESISLWK